MCRSWALSGYGRAECQSGPHLQDGERRGEGQGPVRTVGQAQGGTGGCGEQAQEQQGADCLGGLGGAGSDQGEETEAERARPHPARGGDGLVEGGEEQWAGDQQGGCADRDGDQDGGGGLSAVQAVDGAEENADARVALGGGAVGGVEGEEEGAEAEDPGEQGADDDVVGPSPPAEQAEQQGDADGRGEQPEPQVVAAGESGHRAGEGDVAEGVAGEGLGTQDEEVADQSGGEGDRGAGQQGSPSSRRSARCCPTGPDAAPSK
ncbi:hypothetical protein SAMN06272789_6463 [Streptomyces sp. 1331.2]|nr:hypothetical protein SAMN06272789_6463 [Streptomyces sp. 1331.2]